MERWTTKIRRNENYFLHYGSWIEDIESQFQCSECGKLSQGQTKVCKWCGAVMLTEEEIQAQLEREQSRPKRKPQKQQPKKKKKKRKRKRGDFNETKGDCDFRQG